MQSQPTGSPSRANQQLTWSIASHTRSIKNTHTHSYTPSPDARNLSKLHPSRCYIRLRPLPLRPRCCHCISSRVSVTAGPPAAPHTHKHAHRYHAHLPVGCSPSKTRRRRGRRRERKKRLPLCFNIFNLKVKLGSPSPGGSPPPV